MLWKKRLQIIHESEPIRRIEQAVYKRRWDEQWRIGNAWQCGPAAYDAELLEAFAWWLAEKAEWWLEQRRTAVPLPAWSAALWSDARVQAAWPVTAEAADRLETWKRQRLKTPRSQPSSLDASPAAFCRYFRDLIKSQSVPENIPLATPWKQLQGVRVTAAVKAIRGKHNAPRERFWMSTLGLYRLAVPLG